jgi:hypothetical protein
MDHMTYQAPGLVSDPHARHKMSLARASHDRHSGHSVETLIPLLAFLTSASSLRVSKF